MRCEVVSGAKVRLSKIARMKIEGEGEGKGEDEGEDEGEGES